MNKGKKKGRRDPASLTFASGRNVNLPQSALGGGPSTVMSYFSKRAATVAWSGVPFRMSGPSSS
jgi:hypothetical protein